MPAPVPVSFLSVVVPVRNEAGNVLPLFGEIRAALEDLVPFEVLFVDDGSVDETAAQLATLSDPRVRVLTHRRPCGQSQATLTGALAARGPWIATLDGDGQNDPADLRAVLAACAAAGDMAPHTLFIGRRRERHDGAIRLFASRVANAIRRALLADGTLDSACGLKLLHRDLLLALPRFDALHRFMPALVLRAGGATMSVPIAQRPRVRGRSHYGIIGRGLAGAVDLIAVFWLCRRYTRPDIVRPPQTPENAP